MVDKDPNRMLISALKNKPSILNLSNQNLGVIPVAIGKIDSIKSLVLKNNKVVDLPPEFGCLKKVLDYCFYIFPHSRFTQTKGSYYVLIT